MDAVRAAYNRLLAQFGPQHWWPAASRFEVVVGAVLMAQTSWTNVATAIDRLREAGLLSPRALANAPPATVARLVRVAGLYRSKPKRLREMCDHILRASGGDVDAWLDARETAELREELLGLGGVGPETADSILLLAAGRPVFVVDAYTRRIGQRLGWFDNDDYAAIQRFFEARLPPDVAVQRVPRPHGPAREGALQAPAAVRLVPTERDVLLLSGDKGKRWPGLPEAGCDSAR